jgi:hypothetical protein
LFFQPPAYNQTNHRRQDSVLPRQTLTLSFSYGSDYDVGRKYLYTFTRPQKGPSMIQNKLQQVMAVTAALAMGVAGLRPMAAIAAPATQDDEVGGLYFSAAMTEDFDGGAGVVLLNLADDGTFRWASGPTTVTGPSPSSSIRT